MADPLLVLRDAIKDKSTISFTANGEAATSLKDATHITFPSASFPKSTPTRYKKPSSSTNGYSLEALYLTWLLRAVPGGEYMKGARENGLATGFVSVTERKNVVDWLEGRVGDTDKLISGDGAGTPPGSPTSRTAGLKPSSSSPVKRKYVPDVTDVEAVKKIRKTEIELRDRNSVLRGVKPNNFTSVRQDFAERIKKMKEAARAPPSSTTAPTGTRPTDPKLQAKKARNNFPIIIVSSSPTALVTMYNVKKFLMEAVYEPSATAKARLLAEGNVRAEDMIPIYRDTTSIDSGGRETSARARYVVVDSVEALNKFGPDAWERVVCVMTTGQAWQFKPYKWSDPRILFHHVKGIYMAYTNDPPNTKIKDWNVTELKLDQHRRHVDKSVVAHFWKTLDDWTLGNKPWLIKN